MFEKYPWTKKDRSRLADVLAEKSRLSIPFLATSAQAWLANILHTLGGATVLWVGDSPKTLDLFFQDVLAIHGGKEERLAFFPAHESAPRQNGKPHADVTGDRLKTLQRLAPSITPEAAPIVIATCIQALLQPVPPPHTMASCFQTLTPGMNLKTNSFMEWLTDTGYTFGYEVVAKGQASRRGGVLDLWTPSEDLPLRIEFFGETVETLRFFDPTEQRSVKTLTAAVVGPATEEARIRATDSTRLTQYLPSGTVIIWSEPESIHHHAEMFRGLLAESIPTPPRFEELRRNWKGPQINIGIDHAQADATYELGLAPLESLPASGDKGVTADTAAAARDKMIAALADEARRGWKVHFFLATEGTRARFLESYGAAFQLSGSDAPRAIIHPHALSEGFRYKEARLTVVAESDLYGFRKRLPGRYELHGHKARARGGKTGERITDWADIKPGEWVVHIDHGIGRYLGLYEIEFADQPQEVLTIEYAENAKLYVPVSQAHLLSRYVGIGRARPQMHALGGKRWERERAEAEKATRDYAAALLETQAHRAALDGHAFAPDTPWQAEFEAAFPHTETEDQHRTIQEVKRDMENRRPMDRLVCGDVGYGKTEVAMRAAFKAVMGGKQVLMLAPTTVLVQQHHDTFRERMAAWPVTIDQLSRFRTRTQQAETLARLNHGSLDIVIGTHRLLQKDVRPHNLGLVIVDEEQRFGVRHKEHLKRMRALVDILTLTATPIPRTLYMSLTGARDLSTIQTPPRERLPVETIVAPQTDEVIRDAILRELNRGGQVFYLHNRVQTIRNRLEELQALIPTARVGVGHGQMGERELADVMARFTRGDFDVLLCTTIIESGVDLPNVNTIVIERADRFGMSDLYQLRGRVGRWKHQAYAYLLLPRHGHLFNVARQRVTALKRYGGLGAGFKLALRDLEIRGAGNLLGTAQSGHIAAVGFDLYCQLLKRSVARLKGETPPPIIETELKLDFLDLSTAAGEDTGAMLPIAYIEEESARIAFYRQAASCSTNKEVDALRDALRDRLGPLPPPVQRLLLIARLRITAHHHGIRHMEVDDGKVIMTRRNGDLVQPNGRFPRLKAREATARLEELVQIAAGR